MNIRKLTLDLIKKSRAYQENITKVDSGYEHSLQPIMVIRSEIIGEFDRLEKELAALARMNCPKCGHDLCMVFDPQIDTTYIECGACSWTSIPLPETEETQEV